MSSGIAVDPECIAAYRRVKGPPSRENPQPKLKYIILGPNANNTSVVLLKESESASYDDFLAEFPEAEPRWAVYDMETENKASRLCFISWVPDDAKPKPKMIFAASKSIVKSTLDSVEFVDFQANDFDQISYESVSYKAKTGKTLNK
ncbi:hypothetical protein M422DRAFT_220935 [Sphaerobolus stellatus SS14]|nr:hypothetical protein M422DRAFT_220935 [Sphaerobolus stellatus SS14]